MVIDPQQAANYSVGGVVISGSVFWLIRWVVRTFHIDKLANKSTDAEGNVIDRLEKEISRLETIIAVQNLSSQVSHKEHMALERRLASLQADLFTIRAIIEGSCVCNKPAQKRIIDLINRSISEYEVSLYEPEDKNNDIPS